MELETQDLTQRDYEFIRKLVAAKEHGVHSLPWTNPRPGAQVVRSVLL